MTAKEDYAKIGVDINNLNNGDLKYEDYYSFAPMFFTNNHATVPYINRFKGSSAFLIASGPSLNKIDKSKLYLPGILTMGVNNSASVVRPKLWTCVDPPDKFICSVWLDPTIEKIVPYSHMDKKLFNSEKWEETNIKVSDCPNVFYYRRNGVMNPEDGHWLFENTINWGNHSEIGGGRSVFITAIRMMFLFGVKNLYLVGADFNMDKSNKYAFSQERNQGSINGNNSTYKSMNKWFGHLRSYLEDAGMKVYNCNPESKFTAFESIEFEKAISLALKNFPNVKLEKTDGMYTREEDVAKAKQLEEAKRIAAQFTEEDKKSAKKELDTATTELSIAKAATASKAVHYNLTENDVKRIWQEHKQDPTKHLEYKDLINLRDEEEQKRNMRKLKIERKNLVWGIIK